MSDAREPGQERRNTPRYRTRIPVTFINGIHRCSGVCLDLSYEGMLIELDAETEAPESQLVRVEVAPPDDTPIMLTAAIARRVDRKMGLLLFGISGDPMRVWRALVDRVARQTAR